MPMSTEQIRTRGLAALRDALGRAGLVRFLQQFSDGSGDYTRDRHKWLDQMSLEDIRGEAKRLTRRAPRPKPKRRNTSAR
jgi:hypothetical protein